MTYLHGVQVNQKTSANVPMTQTRASVPVVIGCAPVFQVDGGNGGVVNVPVLCNTLNDFITAFGWSTDYAHFSLCEAADVLFNLMNVGPAVFINALDPVVSGTQTTNQAESLVAGTYTLNVDNVVLNTLVVKDSAGTTTYTLTDDYTVVYDANWHLVITRNPTGRIGATAALKLSYKSVGSGVENAAMIEAGIAAVESVYAVTGMIPGQLVAPFWSKVPEVALALAAEAANIDGAFTARALVDISTNPSGVGALNITQALAWKTANAYTDPNMVVCWPLAKVGTVKYHLSTFYAGARCLLNVANGVPDVPFASASNQRIPITSLCTFDGTAIYQTMTGTNTLEANGIVTAINQPRGWVLWGNRSGGYPGSTDPSLTFNAEQEMFIFLKNALLTSFWQNVDAPLNPRDVHGWLTTINQWLNSLVAPGYLVGASCDFLAADNAVNDLADGRIVLDIQTGYTPPARLIILNVTENTDYLSALFNGNNGA